MCVCAEEGWAEPADTANCQSVPTLGMPDLLIPHRAPRFFTHTSSPDHPGPGPPPPPPPHPPPQFDLLCATAEGGPLLRVPPAAVEVSELLAAAHCLALRQRR